MDLNENANKNNDPKDINLNSEPSSATTTATALSTPTTDTTVVTTRTQPFSFASTYTASVLNPLQDINTPAAFTVLNNEAFFTVSSKPNAIVRPIPRITNSTLSGSRENRYDSSLRANRGVFARHIGEGQNSTGKSTSTNVASISSVAQVEPIEDLDERLHFSDELNRKLNFLGSQGSCKGNKSKNYSKNVRITNYEYMITLISP